MLRKNFFLIFFLLITSTITVYSIEKKDYRPFLSQFISPGALVFDVGAHIGQKSALYLAQGARVVCIEPQPSCYNILKEKFNNNSNVFIEPIGLGEKPDVLTMLICPESTTLSTFSPEWSQISRHKERGSRWRGQIEVQIQTLDLLIKKYGIPQFCKIDVENYEFEVLKGLSSPIPYISFEFHTETLNNMYKCLNQLESIGYQKFNFAAGEYPQLVLNNWVDKDTFIKEVLAYSTTYLQKENDPLWGDVYVKYP